ncbi:endo-1,4-beta-xylanase [Paenibacillus graminis]|uniref:endo-1,4-beta-xylanase n=1 Tax=Paenibacillus graminis TaxID=189425 RepID=UPI002DC03C1A|nr:endo-1,4-beta-xylanase [Paenibacillus graminis]MEC0168588.1 endo-1,4-beta-xylanase [Paenibacillus graminis]
MTQASSGLPALHELFRDAFKIGAAVSTDILSAQAPFIAKHFNSITAENVMKPEEVQPQEGVYTFDAADRIFEFAEANQIGVRGHTLLWHNQTGDWMFRTPAGEPCTREELLSRLQTHIHTVVGRYRGRAYAWDVVNEAIEDKSGQYLRDTKWLAMLGEDYLREAFEMAHQADPDALLFYNDYNETDPVKRDKIYKLVRSLLDQNTPIHGIGMQGHWNIYGPPVGEIRGALELYASLGVRIHITELDLSMFRFEDKRTDLKAPTEEMLKLQEERYAEIFALLLEYRKAIDSVTFWGVADDYTWLDGFPVCGRKNWPFLFDEHQQPKASFGRLAELAASKL